MNAVASEVTTAHLLDDSEHDSDTWNSEGDEDSDPALGGQSGSCLGGCDDQDSDGDWAEHVKSCQSHRRRRSYWAGLESAVLVGVWVMIWSAPLFSSRSIHFVFGTHEFTTRNIHFAGAKQWCNVTIENHTEINTSTCENIEERSDDDDEDVFSHSATAGKYCKYRSGERYFNHFKEFWIGNAETGYFPIIQGEVPIFLMGSDANFSHHCRDLCELESTCDQWTFWFARPSVGGHCYFYPGSAPRIPSSPSHAGGGCESLSSQQVFCGDQHTGRMRNIASWNSPPKFIKWNNSMSDWDAKTHQTDIWCGYFPKRYMELWPNVAQMIVFTAWKNTGTTIKFAFQGVTGTFWACANMLLMRSLFPKGAKGHECTQEEHEAGECELGEMMREDYYNPLIVWIDALGVIFLFLFSGAARNIIMFGMSWHIFFMMDFMNPAIGASIGSISVPWSPNWSAQQLDDYKTTVLVMYILGGVAAILATLLPSPKLNLKTVHADMTALSSTIVDIFGESVDYFCGEGRSPQRFRIETHIDSLAELSRNIPGNLDDAWWESLCLSRGLSLCRAMHAHIGDTERIMSAVKTSVLNEDFQGRHRDFCKAMEQPMRDLAEETKEVARLCTRTTHRFFFKEVDKDRILSAVDRLKQQQKVLAHAYHHIAPEMSEDLAHESVFMFALSYLAHKMADLGETVVRHERKGGHLCCLSLCMHVVGSIRSVWSPSIVFDPEHLGFCVRNFISIVICWCIGYFALLPSIFNAYSPVMPNTLALLVSNYQNSAFQKNIQRLIGVVLGKVLPILMMAIGGASWIGLEALHAPGADFHNSFRALATGIFVTSFTYVYFMSPEYSLVGCLIAGFGVYVLLNRPEELSMSDNPKYYLSRYREIGEVALAIVVQLFVDFIWKKLVRSSPREMAVKHVRDLGRAIKAGYAAFFREDLHGMEIAVGDAEACLQTALSLATECDPKLQVVLGKGTPFKIELYKSVLKKSESLLGDLRMLIAAVKDLSSNEAALSEEESLASTYDVVERKMSFVTVDNSEPATCSMSILRILTSCPAMATVERELMRSLDVILEAFPTILKHKTEDKLNQMDSLLLRDAPSAGYLDEALYEQLACDSRVDALSELLGGQHIELTGNARARLLVSVRTLSNAWQHLSRIQERCLKENN